jgi:TolA-binding protein
MNNLAKSLVVAGIVGAIGTSAFLSASSANAESGSETSSGPMSSLIDRIASTFNIDKSKLQTLFDDEKEIRESERTSERSERLQALVDDGTISATQKSAIEAKIDEMKNERETNRDDLKNLSEDERREKMEEKRSELEAWANSQNLNLNDLRGILGGGPGGFGDRH